MDTHRAVIEKDWDPVFVQENLNRNKTTGVRS